MVKYWVNNQIYKDGRDDLYSTKFYYDTRGNNLKTESFLNGEKVMSKKIDIKYLVSN